MDIKAVKNDLENIALASDYLAYLSLMMVQRANSGHPGLPLGCATIMPVLKAYFLSNGLPSKIQDSALGDRFVLSAGHGSALLYASGYLFDNAYNLKDLSQFRALHSATPGHPEREPERGINTTTGPLGQGFANAVGMALEVQMLRARVEAITDFSVDTKDVYNSKVVVLFGDGCMMEGVTSEAAALAGKLGLGNLIAIYDDNGITIDGSVSSTSVEDVSAKFASLGFSTRKVDGHDPVSIAEGLKHLLDTDENKPKLLLAKTTIGKGLKVAGSEKAHGAPPGDEEISNWIANSKIGLCFPTDDKQRTEFVKNQLESGEFTSVAEFESKYQGMHEWLKAIVQRREDFSNTVEAPFVSIFKDSDKQRWRNDFDADKKPTDALQETLLAYRLKKPTAATRAVSEEMLSLIGEHKPNLIGGSADLVASTKAHIRGDAYVGSGAYIGRNIAYGVREHAMAAIGNGLLLGGHFLHFSSTFLVFLDYLRPAVRLAALMGLPHLFVFTHDSYCVGEDGPTHQPIEHTSSLRLLPGLDVYRPATSREVALSYLAFLRDRRPTALILTRQNIDPAAELQGGVFDNTSLAKNFSRGGYVFYETENSKEFAVTLVASGFEVGVCLKVAKRLEKEGKSARVLSIPSLEKFMQSSHAKQFLGFDEKTRCVLVEPFSLGPYGALIERKNLLVVSLERFGASAPQKDLEEFLNFNEEGLMRKITQKFFND